MLVKRIIPCLDIKNGRTVKGVNFKRLQDAGDPVELGAYYSREGADELVFLDITATLESRETLADLAKSISQEINIPFTVGGGIGSVADAGRLLENGADKITINSAAVQRSQLISELAYAFGSQCVVLAVDAKNTTQGYRVFTHGGSRMTDRSTLEWIKEAVERGAGEILLTSMDADGTRQGFDLELTRIVSRLVDVPVIASGGAGCLEDFVRVFTEGQADAALAAGVFHYREMRIRYVKDGLNSRGIPVRITV
jgi:cyclase